MTRRHRSGRDESGVYLVLFALMLVVLLGISALVLDLARLRNDRATDRSAADFASTAGAYTLSANRGANMAQACQDAFGYVVGNLEDASGGSIGCGTFASACDPASPRTATGSAGPYTVTITNPVPDGHALMQPDAIGSASQSIDADVDGTPCERIGVTITRSRPFSFAGAIGFDSGSTTSASVARALTGSTEGDVVALLVLDPSACNVLTASGQGTILVQANGEKPGAIVVDSSGTGGSGSNNCNTGSRYVIDAFGNRNSSIVAEASASSGAAGVIRLRALAAGQGNTHAYEASDVASGRLSPQPSPGATPVGRIPVDHRYNCKAAGRDGVSGNADDCAGAGPGTAYIDALVASLGGSGTPAGYTRYPRVGVPTDQCSTQPSDPAIELVGNWFVDCPTLTVRNAFTLRGGSVVFRGGLDVQGGSVRINGPNDTPSGDVAAFFRGGGIVKNAQGSFRAPRTFVYLTNGVVNLGAGSGPVYWTAPFGGSFEDLALWSESSSTHSIGGQANLTLDGVFFMPNAQFNFTGQGQQYQVNAQFISLRLDMSGQGILRMQPDPDRVVLIPLFGVRLIR